MAQQNTAHTRNQATPFTHPHPLHTHTLYTPTPNTHLISRYTPTPFTHPHPLHTPHPIHTSLVTTHIHHFAALTLCLLRLRRRDHDVVIGVSRDGPEIPRATTVWQKLAFPQRGLRRKSMVPKHIGQQSTTG